MTGRKDMREGWGNERRDQREENRMRGKVGMSEN